MQPIKLGELIEQLKKRPQDQDVAFEFFRLPITRVESYRGFYDQLAIGFGNRGDDHKKVSELVNELKICIGKTFLGYKGGSYIMFKETNMWAAPWGDCADTAIVGVVDECESITLLRTAYCSW